MSFGDPLVTRAKSAEVFAERKVNVQTDTFTCVAFTKGPDGGLFPVRQLDTGFIPKRDRLIAGVSRTWNIVFLNQ